MKPTRSLKQAVRVWLAENDMQQKDLADAMGVDRATLSRVLNGYRPSGSIEEIAEKLMGATGIDLGDYEQVQS